MAFGRVPKYTEQITLEENSAVHFISFAEHAMSRLNWTITKKSANSLTANIGISLSSYGEQIEVTVTGALATITSKCTGNQVVDWGKNKKNVRALLTSIEEVRTGLSEDELQNKELVLPEQMEDQIGEFETSDNRPDGLLSIFKFRKGYVVTPILVSINVIVFIFMIASGVHILTPEPESLLQWGANFRPSTLDGGFYRLITSCFLHIGIFHLFMNMVALLFVGVVLEPLLGSTRFFVAYILTGLVASVTSLWWNEFVVSAGASGAIFGMYGVSLALLMTKIIAPAARTNLLSSVIVFVGYNLLIGLKGQETDNAGHFGGLVAGLAIGSAYARFMINAGRDAKGLFNIAMISVLVIGASIFVYRSLSNDLPKYDAYLEDFARKEALALEVFQLPDDTPQGEILFQLQDRGLYYWDENIQLLNDADRLSIPPVLHDRLRTLINYCKLRKSSYELMIKAIQENTDKYQPEIEEYNHQLERIIKKLSENL